MKEPINLFWNPLMEPPKFYCLRCGAVPVLNPNTFCETCYLKASTGMPPPRIEQPSPIPPIIVPSQPPPPPPVQLLQPQQPQTQPTQPCYQPQNQYVRCSRCGNNFRIGELHYCIPLEVTTGGQFK